MTMTAEATGVKKIAVNFSKAVDTTTTKIVVKKGAATPTIAATTYAADAKSVEIAMGTKLTAGTYTVEATVGTDTLTADIVAQDEKLTAFELVSPNLVATANNKLNATISYKAVNQYGEMMNADEPTVTCTFGDATPDKPASADKTGTIKVEGIKDIMAIPGTTGTIVLVDGKTGVNLNTTVTYQSKAVASSATVYGIYSHKTEKLIDGNLTTGSKISDYSILINIKDQYNSDMTPEGIVASEAEVSYNAAPVMTDVKIDGEKVVDTLSEVTYEGATCFLIPLVADGGASKIAKAGTLSLTIVSGHKGVLATPSFTIDEAKVIKTLNITPKSTLYWGEKNEMIVEAYDANGDAITKYDDLKAAKFEGLTLEKNADGTAKALLSLADKTGDKNGKYKNSYPVTVVYQANSQSSPDYIVKTATYTAYANRQAWSVAGVTKDTITACAVNSTLEFDIASLEYEDQYGNIVKIGDNSADAKATNVSAALADKNDIFTTSGAAIVDKKITFKSTGKKGSATLYLKYANALDGEDASAEKYDLKVTLSVTEVSDTVASDIEVTVNDGKAMHITTDSIKLVEATANATKANAATSAAVVVKATVNGKKVVLPTSQYTIITDSIGALGENKANKGEDKTEKKTITVVVNSESGPQTVTTEVTVSNVDPKITEIKKNDDVSSMDPTGAADALTLIEGIKVLDQYGNEMADQASALTYTVTVIGSEVDDVVIENNATQSISIIADAGKTVNLSVKYATKDGAITFTRDFKLVFQ